jgi:hypothetical protein
MEKLKLALPALMLFMVACSGEDKQVLIMSSGSVKVSGNTITLDPSTRHNERKISVSDDKLNIVSPNGNAEVAVNNGGGLYILNLKTDTLVGSYQRIGEQGESEKITQEDLRKRIDSLEQLTKGTNVNSEKRNFFIPPGQVSRISTNGQAQVVGPYLKMPASFESGKEHEVYKFYTNKEVYEIIDKLKPMVAKEATQ